MLTESGCRARRKRLWEAVPDHIEWLLVADPRHVNYLSAFWVQPLSFSFGERAFLLLERDQGATLLGDNFTIRRPSAEFFVDRQIVEPWYDHKNSVINRDHALLAALKQVSENIFGRPGAVEAEWLPVGAWEILALDRETHSTGREEGEKRKDSAAVDLGTLLRELRRSKEPDEIALMKRCMEAGAAGHARARDVIQVGVTEFEVYREVQDAAQKKAGCPALVYGDFRASTPLAPKQGGLPTDYALQDGDLFILDYSVILNGYRSDFTNTYAANSPTAEQQELFNLCQTAMRAGEDVLKAGVPAAESLPGSANTLLQCRERRFVSSPCGAWIGNGASGVANSCARKCGHIDRGGCHYA